VSIELTLLIWSTVLLGAYLGAQSLLFRRDVGIAYTQTPMDEDKPTSIHTQRATRALRNFLETYGVFIALAVATELAGRSDALTQWGAIVWFACRWAYLPLYVFGVPYVRSMVWFVSGLGLAAMFLGVVV
jgi:uncharacterized MAPEG superfamily protein